ncbi:MAG: alpha-galactosidase [Oscillospiraceae bacterium]|nr:alpha-galactosidase [Oscillospiraceae bacterium]
MKMNLSGFTVSCDVPITIDLTASEKNGVSLFTFSLGWDPETLADATSVTVSWQRPMLDHMYYWTPSRGLSRKVLPDWAGEESSMVSKSAPVSCIFDGRSRAQYVWALDECQKLVFCKNGVIEENGEMLFAFRLPLKQYTAASCTKVTLRADERGLSFAEALGDVARWWEKDCGMTPASVPDTAKAPVYSFWYSFHQNVIAAEVEKECRRAKKLGFDICIIDDGWQTDDNSRGYAFCGDWEACPAKIPDMAAHVRAVHDIGMKYILWYSVPFVGYHSRHYKEFEGKYLYQVERLNCAVLDPRYKEVREYLTGIYLKALREWELDGFKLDFIDQWHFSPDMAPYDPAMDIPDLFDAADRFMLDTITALRAVKPDILLEFRQGYIGPNMRKYGNMFRAGDCPNDHLSNRVSVFDLRMLMGDSAVHSDMLMWHPDEKPETAALQIISVLFGVLQYSAKLEHMEPATYEMSRFWLNFVKKHRDLLLESPLEVYEPHLLYTWAKAASDTESIAVAYTADKCLVPDVRKTIYLVNGTMSDRILCELEGRFALHILNCCGEEISHEEKTFSSITALNVPAGGMAVLEDR